VNAISAGKVRKEVKMGIERAHSLLGHINEDATRRTAHQLGWTLTRGSSKPCEHCAQAKAKQKNVNKGAVIQRRRSRVAESMLTRQK
jgi:hypothetical protein